MPVTKEQVITLLRPDEPDYEFAARLGGEALPYIVELVKADDTKLASRATYLAAFIDLPGSAEIIAIAAQSPDPIVRVAAAASIKLLSERNLKELPQRVFVELLSDDDPGVRKWALTGTEKHRPSGLKHKVRELAEEEPIQELRERARRVLRTLPDT